MIENPMAAHAQGRRVVTTAWGQTVFVRPKRRMPHAEWSVWFERRALLAGYIAVIDGVVVERAIAEAA